MMDEDGDEDTRPESTTSINEENMENEFIDDDESEISNDDEEEDNVHSRSESSNVDADIGIAIAGGSLRAAAAGCAILRGLQQKKILVKKKFRKKTISAMDRVKYNCGSSGGAIPAILYSYAQIPVDELLDTYRTIDPTQISKQSLNEISQSSMLASLTKIRLERISTFICNNFSNAFHTHSYFSKIVYQKFYQKYHVPRNKYFTSSEEEMERIIDMEMDPKVKRENFLLPRKDIKALPMIITNMRGSRHDLTNVYFKKYTKIRNHVWREYQKDKDRIENIIDDAIILGDDAASSSSTMSKPDDDDDDKKTKSKMTNLLLKHRDDIGNGNLPIPVTITPDGVETKFEGNVLLGGSYVKFPLEPVLPFMWGEKKDKFGSKRFSVEFMNSLSVNTLGMKDIPIFSAAFSCMRNIKLNEDGRRGTQLYIDGGYTDSTGIIPLLQHDEIKEIIFVYNFNKSKSYTTEKTPYADIYKATCSTKYTDPNFHRDFREWLKHMNPIFTCLFGYFGQERDRKLKEVFLNHVFHDPKLDKLKELMVTFNSLFEAGEPLIATLKGLELIENPFFGIPKTKPRRKVNLTIIFFNTPKKFSEQVPIEAVPPPKGKDKIDKDGRFNNKEFRCVPELPTRKRAHFYTNAQINMMGYLGSWMIDHSWDGLMNKDGQKVFKGFRRIFEKDGDEK